MKILIPAFALSFLALQLSCARPMQGQSIEIAKDYYVHNVKGRALESFIDVYHNSKAPEVKTEALSTWGKLPLKTTITPPHSTIGRG